MADRSYLFWPFFDPRHLELHDRIETWAAATIGNLDGAVRATNASTIRRLAEQMGKAGFLATTPGGRDALLHGPIDMRSLCICREVLARHASVADFVFAAQRLGTGPIALFGTEEQKARWLPSAAQGKSISAFALSEATADVEASASITRAHRDGDHWRLHGVKSWIANAETADLYVVFARTGEAPSAKRLSAFVVTADMPGVSVARTTDRLVAQPIGTIVLDDVKVPSANMLGAPGDGSYIARAALDVFRPTAGAAALGLARLALDEATRLARLHELPRQSLSDFRLTHAKLADMAIAIDATALLIYRGAWTRDIRGVPVTHDSSMARKFAAESARKVIGGAAEIFAGLGTSHAHTLARLHREMRMLRIYERASEIQEAAIAAPLPAEAEVESCGPPIYPGLSAMSGDSIRPHR
jgi:alkylation response protein AidB-like acyl-CoA dehydrogenase